jgi:lysophospholipid acyltransferase (LPLAT)-like uncharacterized protein
MALSHSGEAAPGGQGRRPGVLVAGPSPLEERSRRRMSRTRRALYATAAPISLGLVRALWSTYRLQVVGGEAVDRLVAAGRPMILTLWHGSVFVASRYLRHLARAGVRVTYLVSPSVDGELGTMVLERLGCDVVRGSATRSGVKAIRGLYKAMRAYGASPVVLPDGPLGPRHHCKPGSLLLGRMSKAPVVPMAVAARPAWHAPTWDRALVPLPFATVRLVIGEPYELPPDLDEAGLSDERVRLEALLGELEARAEEMARSR